ncbi:carboxypeptidase-like regulatory domain-containing protein [Flavobacterium dankookense]|uniref:Carboxypeptidase-like protein n=1 Tax=Flavobacterium dankookense TaxID=706186 RepID=A0A4R6QCY5_9FLAO|nr:carboxypeptidase-like regulatory domain-containing protein [Flavobacterium dankookense]TDP60037.1 carboxypeptidase-like protein [Flavobacterium dankookense]
MRTFLVLLIFSSSLIAQTKGIIVDENNLPIPYVNIWVEGENIGTTSEEDGTFTIDSNDGNKNLIFSILGFEKKILKLSDSKKVILQSQTNELNEIVIVNKKETKEKEIGQVENSILQAFENGPKIDVKYFPYNPKYKSTRYIKQVRILTDSKLETATLKIHFYGVDENGLPGEKLLKKDFIVSIKKGGRNNKINVSNFNLAMPKTGIFVGFEKLMIESNKEEKTTTDPNTKVTTTKRTYYPLLLYNYIDRDFIYTFSGGKWIKETTKTEGLPRKINAYQPAINLILTN